MNCVIDAGNTRIKVAFFSDNTLVKNFSVFSDEPDEILEYLTEEKPEKIILSSVKNLPKAFTEKLTTYSKFFIHFNSKTILPFDVVYTTPDTLGNDRKALIAGAVYFHPKQNNLVISAGTCITYDFINSENIYLGGAISPGLHMRLKALHDFTDALPLLPLPEELPQEGNSTQNSIYKGTLMGAILEIEGFISEYSKKYSQLNCILSGGDGRYIHPFLKTEIEIIPELGLWGLHQILLQHDS